MNAPPPSTRSFFEELKRRRVVRTTLAYTAAVFALLQGAQPVFDGLLLPDLAFRALVILTLTGFPVVVALAWVYELTADGIRRTEAVAGSLPSPRRVPLRRWLQIAGVFLMSFIVAAGTAAGLGRLRFPAAADDGRVGVAIFPFRTTQQLDEAWSEGAADLLASALDGTAGLRIVDPWTLWRPLRTSTDAPALPPDPEYALQLAERFGAHRVVLGSIVPGGERVDATFRIYQVGRDDPIASFVVNGDAAGLMDVVREAGVRVLARVWGGRRPSDLPTELDFDATRSVESLKAYLAAKDALRRGRLDSANVAIDRAIALDSSFVLAFVEAVTIKSWGFSSRGQPYSGFFELLDRVDPYLDSVSPRTKLRMEAVRASIRTDGVAAYGASRRILDIDPSDLGARFALAYYERAYGWQFGASLRDGRERIEEVVRMDSTYVPVLAARAWWSIAMADSADQRIQLFRLERADTSGALGIAWLNSLRATLSTDAEFEAALPAYVQLPLAQRIPLMSALRVANPSRAELFYDALRAAPDPAAVAQAEGELARLDISRGRVAPVDSAIRSGAFRDNQLFRRLQFLMVASSLADLGEDSVTAGIIAELEEYLPADSAMAYFDSRPVWWGGWLIGAHHASVGDTLTARAWIDAIGTLPRGGSTDDYVGALQSDIASRLAMRRGDREDALRQAGRAFELWGIHADNSIESSPAPMMRFNLGLLYRQAGQADSARAMFESLVPPTTWVGFLTARASFELGDLEAERGDSEMAVFHYTRALRMWQGAGPGAVEWLERTSDRLTRSVRG